MNQYKYSQIMKTLSEKEEIILILALIIFSHAEIFGQGFVLIGTLNGFEDNTKLVINSCLPNMEYDMDSTIVVYLQKGKFSIEGNYNKPTKLSLRVHPKDPSNVVDYETMDFWVENKPMILEGTKGSIFQSKISGSVIQEQYEEYIVCVASLSKQIKQIKDSVLTYKDISEDKKSEMRVRYHAYIKEKEDRKFEFIYSHPEYYVSAAEMVFYITFIPQKLNKKDVVHF